MQWKALVVVIALATHALPVLAEDSGVYLGVKLGAYEIEQGDIDSNEFALGAYAGYRYSAYLAFEAEATHLYSDNILGGDFDGNLLAISVVPTLPLNESWDLFAKLGWAWLDFELDSSFLANTGESDEDDDFFWGLGTSWHGKRWELRAELQGDADADLMLYTIGLGYRF